MKQPTAFERHIRKEFGHVGDDAMDLRGAANEAYCRVLFEEGGSEQQARDAEQRVLTEGA